MRKNFPLCFIFSLLFSASFLYPHTGSSQTAGLDASVMVYAEALDLPPRITLRWNRTLTVCDGFQIFRKRRWETEFTLIEPELADTVFKWTDTTVESGQEYEYQVLRFGGAATWSGSTAMGYVCSGVNLKARALKGRILLVTDSALTLQAQTRAAIFQWKQDVQGEGWDISEIRVQSSETPPQVKAKIAQVRTQLPLRALFLLGRVPVPYSGNLAPDGHPDHFGAWPADGYYADFTTQWTDNLINNGGATDPRNRNLVGDGKFDQSTCMPDLECGRVDMRNLPVFNLPESSLILRYLAKNHRFRTRKIQVADRGMHDDQATGLGFSAFAWRNLPGLCRNQSIPLNPYYWIGTGNFRTSCTNHDFLWSGIWGPGSYTSVGSHGVGMFASDSLRTVFTAFIGSYFGDWDSPSNNFMKASLASRGSLLTTCWSGRPLWYFHHMAMGESIGYSALLSMRNQSTYNSGDIGARGVHLALLGDPTLKLHPRSPVQSVQAQILPTGKARLSWLPPQNDTGCLGYRIFRKHLGADVLEDLGFVPVSTQSWDDPCLLQGPVAYGVRPVYAEKSATGTYENLACGKADTLLFPGGNGPGFAGTLRIQAPADLGTCPGQKLFQLQGNPGPNSYQIVWFRDGKPIDTVANSLQASLWLNAQTHTVRAILVREGTCAIPRQQVLDEITINRNAPPAPSTNFFIRGESCKNFPTRIEASLSPSTYTAIGYRWWVNQLYQGQTTEGLLIRTFNGPAIVKCQILFHNPCGQRDSLWQALEPTPLDTLRPNVDFSLLSMDSCEAGPPSVQVRVTSSVDSRQLWYKNNLPYTPQTSVNSGIRNWTLTQNLNNDDVLQLRWISNRTCTTIDTLFYNPRTVRVLPNLTTGILLEADSLQACSGKSLSISAQASVPHPRDRFLWYRNQDTLSGPASGQIPNLIFQAGDSLRVRYISAYACPDGSQPDTLFSTWQKPTVLPVSANSVQVAPFADSLCAGQVLRLKATPQGAGNQPMFRWYRGENVSPLGTDSILELTATVPPDSFRVVLRSSLPCPQPDSSLSIWVKPRVFPQPLAQIDTNGLQFSVSGHAGFQIRWYRDGVLLPANPDSLVLALDSGWYTVVLSGPGGCRDSSEAVWSPGVVAVSPLKPVAGLRLYPNPARDVLTLAGNWGEWIWIADVLGRKRRLPVAKTGTVDLRDFPPGLYRAIPEKAGPTGGGVWFSTW